jgi:cobalt-zinc-cadmium efflux system membrane fusion protein
LRADCGFIAWIFHQEAIMKKLVLALLVLVAGLAAVAGVAVVRPDLLPKWAKPAAEAQAQADDGGLRCVEHGVPEKFCTLCHPELKGKLMWCEEHGVPEDICTLCHPELKAKYNVTTCEHGLPAEFCPKCGKGQSPNLVDDGWCTEHNQPKATCPKCKAEAAEKDEAAEKKEEPKGEPSKGEERAEKKADVRPLSVVKLKRPELAGKLGLQTAPVIEERHAHTLRANAEVAYNASRYAEVRPRIAGFAREVKVEAGDDVHRGDVLAVIDSAEVGTAKAQYITAASEVTLAEATHKRTTALVQRDAVPGKNQLEAETALNRARASLMEAEQRLRNFGFTDTELARIRETRDTTTLLPVVSPIDGTVVAREATAGEAVEPTTRLFDVADTSSMWAWIDVSERDAAQVAKGQPVTFTVTGTDGSGYSGHVTWIGTEVNPQTRTTRVRAELKNHDGKLRANQFGRAEIQVGAEHAAVIVPKAAVQDFERARLVFLAQADGSFRPQRVTTRPTSRSDSVEVTWGVKPGQRVVTARSYLLKTELMRDALGAGCTDD